MILLLIVHVHIHITGTVLCMVRVDTYVTGMDDGASVLVLGDIGVNSALL